MDLTTGQYSLHLHRESGKTGVLVHILPPLTIRNFVPLPITLSLANKKYGFRDVTISKGGTYNEHSFTASVGKTKCVVGIQGFKAKRGFSVFTRKEGMKSQTVELEGGVWVEVELADVGNRRLSIYVPCLILNQTYLPLRFYYENRSPISGQTIGSEIILARSCSNLRLNLDDSKKVKFPVKTAGTQREINLRTKDGMNYALAYKVEISWVTPEEYLHTKVVTIAPRYILVNSLNTGLNVRQHNTTEHIFSITPGARSPIYWINGDLPEEIQILLEDSDLLGCEKWLWSQAFPMSVTGAVTIVCESETRGVRYVRVNSLVDGISSIFTFEEEPEAQAAYRIVNESQYLYIACRQTQTEPVTIVNPGTSTRFAWRFPTQPQELDFQVLYPGLYPDTPISLYRQKISFRESIDSPLLLLSRSGELGQAAYLSIERQGVTKCLILSDRPADVEPGEATAVLELTLPKFGFSLVANTPLFTTELVYLTLEKVKFSIIRSFHENLYRLQVGYIQADNQYLPASDFPVAFHSAFHADYPSLVATVITAAPGRFDLRCFKAVTLEVNKIVCKLESPLVQQVLDLWTRLHVTLKTYSKGRLAELFDTSPETPSLTPGWTMASKIDQILYIERILVQQLAIEVHFRHVKDPNPGNEDSLAWFLTAMGTVPINIDGVPIELEGLYMTDLSGTQGELQQVLQDFYIADAKRSLLKLIGYSDLVGNPLGVLNRFSQSNSLRSVVSSTMDLTVGTVSKIGQGIATGLMAVTQGREAVRERQREKIKFRPKNFIQGVGYGTMALLKGVGLGVAGLVVKPIRGARQSGFGGLLRGSFQGVSGLVARPVVGMLDLGSNTVEGLINSAKKKDGDTRRRYPRPVYSVESKLREFNALDAAVLFGLFRKRRNCRRLMCVLEGVSEDGAYLLVLFVEMIYLFRNGKKKVKVETGKIQCAFDSGEGVTLILHSESSNELFLPISQAEDRSLLLHKLSRLIDL